MDDNIDLTYNSNETCELYTICHRLQSHGNSASANCDLIINDVVFNSASSYLYNDEFIITLGDGSKIMITCNTHGSGNDENVYPIIWSNERCVST